MEQIRLALARDDGTYQVFDASATVEHVKRTAIVKAHLNGYTARVVLVKIEELPDSASTDSGKP